MPKNDRPFLRRLRMYMLTIAVTLSLLVMNSALSADTVSDREQLKKEVIDLIVSHHVSGIGEKDLDTSDLDSILASLGDPYTEFFTPGEWKKFMNVLENQYSGIGIRLGLDDHGFFVHEVFPDSPAMKSGMLDGDYIVAVNGASTSGKTTDDLVAEITGEEGTPVRITVERNDEKIEMTIMRGSIRVPVLIGHRFDNGTGYIRLTSFSTNADDGFEAMLGEMKEQGLSALVLDLRDNPGGLLETAGGIAGQFIEEGPLIYARDRSGNETMYRVSGGETLDVPVLVLVNEFSASASEVLAGALRDHGIATLVGRKTYGKGSVQNTYELAGGSVLKLTVQEYLTPLKHKVNRVGLAPEIEVFGDTAQLVTALQKAGDINIALELGKNELMVSGMKVNGRFGVIRDSGRVYVPSRVLSSVVDGRIAWDPEARSVVIEQANTRATFASDAEGVVMENGTAFIELALFERHFPAFDWSDDREVLRLIEKGEE